MGLHGRPRLITGETGHPHADNEQRLHSSIGGRPLAYVRGRKAQARIETG
jgi:hypothetical protein